MSEQAPKEVENKQADNEEKKQTEETNQGEGDGKLSREELKKIKEEKKKREKEEKEAKKAARLKEEEEQKAKKNKVIPYTSEDIWGEYECIQSLTHNQFSFVDLWELDQSKVGQIVRVRARLHTSRGQGNLIFITLRKGMYSVQAVATKSDTVPKDLMKFIEGVSKESVVDVVGEITAAQEEVHSTTQKTVELQIQKFYVVSRSQETPFILEDACRRLEAGEDEEAEQSETTEGDSKPKMPIVSLTKRLDNRVIDLRVPAHVAIFRVQSMVGQLFREYLIKNSYIEIHSPKILGGQSEGGAEVFKTTYFGKPASLAQSPQLYKQMAIMGEFGKVFEIGPVFRAENSNTGRHLCEFTGLDFEMEIKESYLEVVDTIGELFNFMFTGLNERCSKEFEVIQQQYPFKPFEWAEKFVSITFEEACKLLKEEKGIDQRLDEDFSRKSEEELGNIIKDKYKSDFYIVHKYPESARPFYTMPHKEAGWTCSYDVFMRGTEIISGAQRCHDPVLLTKRIAERGIDPSGVDYYIDSFKYGALPHGGVGVGLERVTSLFLNLGNVRKTSLFPRDPSRLRP